MPRGARALRPKPRSGVARFTRRVPGCSVLKVRGSALIPGSRSTTSPTRKPSSRCSAPNSGSKLNAFVNASFPWCNQHLDGLRKLFEAYAERKRSQNVFDFDDLLLFWNRLLADPVAGPLIRKRFDCVLVDEYQDTNPIQSQILRQLCPDGQGLTVVGDDAQSIYSFRGATVRNILDFPKQFPGATVVRLE